MDQKKKDSEKSDNCRQTNDSPDEEKPLKKARYIWEVKGKQHLKNNCQKSEDVLTSCSHSVTQAGNINREYEGDLLKETEDTSKVDATSSQENNAESSHCCFGDIIERSSDAIDRAMDGVLNEHYRPEVDKSPNSHHESGSCTSPNTDDANISASKEETYEDYMILKWQARQIARGYVDNTINTMLETEMYEQPIVRPRRIFEAPDRIDFVDFNVEHEAIFEAIKTHGLQSKEEQTNHDEGGESSRENKTDRSSETSSNEQEKPSNSEISNQSTSSALSPNRSTFISATDEPLRKRLDTNEEAVIIDEVSQSYNCELGTDPMDFLNAAVSVAIQKKGLTCG